MFGTIVDKLQALLSRNFLIAVFFPVLIFVVASGLVSYLAFPAAAQALQAWWAAGLTAKAEYLADGLIAVAVLAYTLSPLTVLSRRALEADFRVLSGLARHLRDTELESAKELNTKVKLAIRHLTRAERVTTQLLGELPKRRASGCDLKSLTDPAGIDRALKQVEEFAVARRSWKPAGIAAPEAKSKELTLLEDTSRELGRALTYNSANLSSTQTAAAGNSTDQDIARSEELQNAYMEFRAQCKDYLATARHDAAEYAEEQHVRFPPSNIRATKFANIRCAAESYASRTYAVEFEYLWPRMQFVLAKDDKGGAMVDLAKTQVDYSVLLVTLAVIFFVIWLPLLCIFSSSPLMFLWVGIVAPPVVVILYQLALESERLFGSVLRATIDRYRLDVLASLSLPPPGSLAVERQRWTDLQRATAANGLLDLPLRVAPK